MSAPPSEESSAVTLTQKIGNLIRYWVHYDTTLATLNKQARQVRDARNATEQQIFQSFGEAKLENPVIQIVGGRIVVGQDRHAQPLTFKSLETHLKQYYRSKPGAKDETAAILAFIKSQREVTSTPVLRRVMTAPPQPPPSG